MIWAFSAGVLQYRPPSRGRRRTPDASESAVTPRMRLGASLESERGPPVATTSAPAQSSDAPTSAHAGPQPWRQAHGLEANQTLELLRTHAELTGPVLEPPLATLPLFGNVPEKFRLACTLRRLVWGRTLQCAPAPLLFCCRWPFAGSTSAFKQRVDTSRHNRCSTHMLASCRSAFASGILSDPVAGPVSICSHKARGAARPQPWVSPAELAAAGKLRARVPGGYQHAVLRYPAGCGFLQRLEQPAVWCTSAGGPCPHQLGGGLADAERPLSACAPARWERPQSPSPDPAAAEDVPPQAPPCESSDPNGAAHSSDPNEAAHSFEHCGADTHPPECESSAAQLGAATATGSAQLEAATDTEAAAAATSSPVDATSGDEGAEGRLAEAREAPAFDANAAASLAGPAPLDSAGAPEVTVAVVRPCGDALRSSDSAPGDASSSSRQLKLPLIRVRFSSAPFLLLPSRHLRRGRWSDVRTAPRTACCHCCWGGWILRAVSDTSSAAGC